MAADDKVVIGQTHGDNDPEAVLIGYLLGVEALRAGKEVLMWLTKDGVRVATNGRFFACPVCVKSRGLEGAEWVKGAEVKGAPSLFEFTTGGSLTFNY